MQTSQYVRNPEILSTDVDDEAVLLSIEKQSYFGLPATSRRIWELLAEPQSIASLCTVLMREYEVDAATCNQDVATFIDQLRRENLVQPV